MSPFTILLGWLMAASAVGGFIYLLFRGIEKVNNRVLLVPGAVLIAAFLFSAIWNPSYESSKTWFSWGAGLFFVCVIGACGHLLSGGRSSHFFGALMFMVTATFFGGFISQIFPIVVSYREAINYRQFSIQTTLLLLDVVLLSIAFMPFLIWAVNSLKLRPGIDKHFDE
ncbi:hypothetical protein B1R32_10782 [Abditibacterium utsteinense]|uniref:Uncharacterized protein n=1 Tax=Abditibacterium utsteinense TaxID=1960156 RepID=A0A2S8STD5_9BACT|nr:hypothetical protein [Abditibacterium utsteinense]PQV64057.1 hypothetical protein B1R32_10782 [Abditibacterium utsteinense]